LGPHQRLSDGKRIALDRFNGHRHELAVAHQDPRACRKSNPGILVVQPAENWAAKNLPGPFDGARERRILLQG
jgi:hypothetical protein